MSDKIEIEDQISYIKRVMEYSSRDYSRVYPAYFGWTAVFFIQYIGQALLRTVGMESFDLNSSIFYGNHRITGLLLSLLCILLSTLIYLKIKGSSQYGSSSIARVLLKMWFTATLILILNDSSNYIPFAFAYDVSIIYETIWQVLISTTVLFLMLMFTYHLAHSKQFLSLAVGTVVFGVLSVIASRALLQNDINMALVLDFSQYLCILAYLLIALLLRAIDRSH